MLEVLKKNLTSKKLWVAVISFAFFAMNGDWNQALFIVLTYLGIQGYVDVKINK